MTDEFLHIGISIIKERLRQIPTLPGVYRMMDAKSNILYVGKAKNLAKRIINYTKSENLTPRIMNMVSRTKRLEIITTSTETEALLLEANMIRTLKPKYNVLLKDGKSFPYILIRTEHDFPQITKYRGNKKEKGLYFGPYLSSGIVSQTIKEIQKIFFIRPCTDNFFDSRKRPCIEYQIKRCSGPCANKISKEEYKVNVKQAIDFLSGKSTFLQQELQNQMDEASKKMNYEKAAMYRDKIKALTAIQNRNSLLPDFTDDIDIIAVYKELGQVSIQVFFLRGGQNFGNKSFILEEEEDFLSNFLMQFYTSHNPPKLILINEIDDNKIIEEALFKLYNIKVKVFTPKNKDHQKLIEFALNNAKQALNEKISKQEKNRKIHLKIAEIFGVSREINRIEVYDNSHIMGTSAVGAMIVATQNGFDKKEYRKFNFNFDQEKIVKGGDDYKMLEEMLTRRFTRMLKEHPIRDSNWPDLLIIDGGMSHLNIAKKVIQNMPLEDIIYIAMSKGPDRHAGREIFHLVDGRNFSIDKHDPVMKYLQIIRDEAHNYAISSHRKRRSMKISNSKLDNIKNIGAKRKKMLLNYFGSVEAVENASIDDLQRVESINQKIAEEIYNFFHKRKD